MASKNLASQLQVRIREVCSRGFAAASLCALLALPRVGMADPLTLIDPFSNQSNSQIAEFFGAINNPNVGNGTDWIVDSQLPFSGSAGFGRNVNGALAWGSLDTLAGYIQADLVNAMGFAHTSNVYTHDLPTGVALSVAGNTGVRAAAALSVWGPSLDGVFAYQNPSYYGGILWELQSSELWFAERWTWSGGPLPTQVTLASDTQLNSFDWTNLGALVNSIADGREVGYYEVVVATSAGQFGDPNGVDVHARLNFADATGAAANVPEPSMLLLFGLGLVVMCRRRT